MEIGEEESEFWNWKAGGQGAICPCTHKHTGQRLAIKLPVEYRESVCERIKGNSLTHLVLADFSCCRCVSYCINCNGSHGFLCPEQWPLPPLQPWPTSGPAPPRPPQ
eukprot:1175736-Rhodomonas_salina.1